MDTLVLGTPAVGTLAADQRRYYQLVTGPDHTVRLTLDSQALSGANEVYVRLGDVPDQVHYDYVFQSPFSPDQVVTIPTTQEGTYYILVRGNYVPGGSASYSLLAEIVPLALDDITPDEGGDQGYVTTTLVGAGFNANATVHLVRPGFADVVPESYQVVDGTRIVARFVFEGVPHGLYDVVVTNPDGQQAILPYRYFVTAADAPDLHVGLDGPTAAQARQHRLLHRRAAQPVQRRHPLRPVPVRDPREGRPRGFRDGLRAGDLGLRPRAADQPPGHPRDRRTSPGAASIRSTSSSTTATGRASAGGTIYGEESVYGLAVGFPAFSSTFRSFTAYVPDPGIFPKDLLLEEFQLSIPVVAAATPLTPAEYIALQREASESIRRRVLAIPRRRRGSGPWPRTRRSGTRSTSATWSRPTCCGPRTSRRRWSPSPCWPASRPCSRPACSAAPSARRSSSPAR